MSTRPPAQAEDSGTALRPTVLAVLCALGMTVLAFLIRGAIPGREPRWLGILLPRSQSSGSESATAPALAEAQTAKSPPPGRVSRMLGRTRRERAGTLITVAGALTLLYAVGTFLEITPGSHVVIPDPPALSRARPTFTEQSASGGAGASVANPAVSEAVEAASTDLELAETSEGSGAIAAPGRRRANASRPALALGVPDADELVRAERVADRLAFEDPVEPLRLKRMPRNADSLDRLVSAGYTRPGIPVTLSIERIGINTEVIKAGLQEDDEGNVIWETVPDVAAYYTPTSLVGARGNAVIAGHVVTLYEGNVFANLYQVDFGDKIQVATAEGTFVYEVRDIKLVLPEDVHVMAPTRDATLTLITCGGEFDRWAQTFEKRLVVVGKLIRT